MLKRIFAILLVFAMALVVVSCEAQDGKSAYEIAVENGFEGTVEEWLASLEGDKGAKGEKGEDGEDAVTPVFKIEGDILYVSYNYGVTWTALQKVVGENGITPQFKLESGNLYVSYDNGTNWTLLGALGTGSTGGTGGGSSSGDGGSTGGTTPTQPTLSNVDDLPDEINFEGETISLLAYVQSGINENSFDANRDGDVINNAVYDRNQDLKIRLNCKLDMIDYPCNTNNEGEGSLLSQMESLKEIPVYHVVTTGVFQMVKLVEKGLLHDLACTEYIDLDKDYYHDSYNDVLNIGGRQYLVTGRISLSWYRYQVVTFLNRNLLSDSGKSLSAPYDLVKSGDWTLANMAQLAADMYQDDGDNIYEQSDTYGYYLFAGSGSSQTDGYMSAFDLHMTAKNDDGYLEKLDVDTNRWTEIFNQFFDLAYTKGTWLGRDASGGGNGDGTTDSNDTVEQKFLNYGAGMITYRLYMVEKNAMIMLGRTMEGYGVLPLPKADDTQQNYYSCVQDQLLAFGIPLSMTGDDYINAQIFLEAYSSGTYNTLMNTYYEKGLTKKFVCDTASHEMLQIIDDTVTVDAANIYGLGVGTGYLRKIYSEERTLEYLFNNKMLGEESPLSVKIREFNDIYEQLDRDMESMGYHNVSN